MRKGDATDKYALFVFEWQIQSTLTVHEMYCNWYVLKYFQTLKCEGWKVWVYVT